MNDREIIEALQREAETHTPDVPVDLHAARVQGRGEVVALSRKKPLVITLCALLFVILLSLAVLLPVLLGRGGGGLTTLVISINPSAEFTLENGKVTKTRALNHDAAVLLAGQNLDGKTAEEACLTFAQLAGRRNLIGTDGVRIRASGKNGKAVARSVESALSEALFAVGDLDDAAFEALFGVYDEDAMDRFEDYVTQSYSSKKAEYLDGARELLSTYPADLESLDMKDLAAVREFNRKYLKLGEDFLIEEDEDDPEGKIRQELLGEYEEIVHLLETDPDEAFEELFEEFLELFEEAFEEDD